MRSRTGCLTCRRRKVKCDEVKPSCGQCQKSSRDCCLSESIVFRHQHNASMNAFDEVSDEDSHSSPQVEKGSLGKFYGYKKTFKNDTFWRGIPRDVTFVEPKIALVPKLCHADKAYQSDPSTTSGRIGNSFDGLHWDDGVAVDESQSGASTGVIINNGAHSTPHFLETDELHLNFTTTANDLSFILNPFGSPLSRKRTRDSSIVPNALDLNALHRTSSISSRPEGSKSSPDPITDPEVAFLMRHFSEVTGLWMDLFDLRCYFARWVPVQALSNKMLLYAASAYAAKQLGLVRKRRKSWTKVSGAPSLSGQVDWEWYGAKYYDKAISLLVKELGHSDKENLTHTDELRRAAVASQAIDQQNLSPSEDISNLQDIGTVVNSFGLNQLAESQSKSDETLAAAAILCVYEFSGATNLAWSYHLSGTKSLFDLTDTKRVTTPQGVGNISNQLRPNPSRARKATFWNFARQDYLAAFINDTCTRLNTDDLSLWRAAGLQIDLNGFIISSADDCENVEDGTAMQEDMVSNGLVWILSKIMNYLASRHATTHPASIGYQQQNEKWQRLCQELDVWYSGLPRTFQPSARLAPSPDANATAVPSPRTIFSEIWFSLPMCASAVQSYHMARILLLLNKPVDPAKSHSAKVFDKLSEYRSLVSHVQHHSHEICGISIAISEGSVRIHSLQPLFVAGQCLEEEGERRVILGFLRDVESDLGWATEYRCTQLLQEWGWENEIVT